MSRAMLRVNAKTIYTIRIGDDGIISGLGLMKRIKEIQIGKHLSKKFHHKNL